MATKNRKIKWMHTHTHRLWCPTKALDSSELFQRQMMRIVEGNWFLRDFWMNSVTFGTLRRVFVLHHRWALDRIHSHPWPSAGQAAFDSKTCRDIRHSNHQSHPSRRPPISFYCSVEWQDAALTHDRIVMWLAPAQHRHDSCYAWDVNGWAVICPLSTNKKLAVWWCYLQFPVLHSNSPNVCHRKRQNRSTLHSQLRTLTNVLAMSILKHGSWSSCVLSCDLWVLAPSAGKASRATPDQDSRFPLLRTWHEYWDESVRIHWVSESAASVSFRPRCVRSAWEPHDSDSIDYNLILLHSSGALRLKWTEREWKVRSISLIDFNWCGAVRHVHCLQYNCSVCP